MFFVMSLLRPAVAAAVLLAGCLSAQAAAEFPFGQEVTLDVAPQPGSKRVPTLEFGSSGETRIDLWCKHGKGQFSVAGNTVIFVPGVMDAAGCTPARAQADDELLAALGAATNWTRQVDSLSFSGGKPLRFFLNLN